MGLQLTQLLFVHTVLFRAHKKNRYLLLRSYLCLEISHEYEQNMAALELIVFVLSLSENKRSYAAGVLLLHLSMAVCVGVFHPVPYQPQIFDEVIFAMKSRLTL